MLLSAVCILENYAAVFLQEVCAENLIPDYATSFFFSFLLLRKAILFESMILFRGQKFTCWSEFCKARRTVIRHFFSVCNHLSPLFPLSLTAKHVWAHCLTSLTVFWCFHFLPGYPEPHTGGLEHLYWKTASRCQSSLLSCQAAKEGSQGQEEKKTSKK